MEHSGALLYKHFVFPLTFSQTYGQSRMTIMKDNIHHLQVKDRLRLYHATFGINRRIRAAESYSVFVAQNGPIPLLFPYRNCRFMTANVLITEMKENYIAYKLQLSPRHVMYVLPPCKFSEDLLNRTCPSLTEGIRGILKLDHLVCVVITDRVSKLNSKL